MTLSWLTSVRTTSDFTCDFVLLCAFRKGHHRDPDASPQSALDVKPSDAKRQGKKTLRLYRLEKTLGSLGGKTLKTSSCPFVATGSCNS